MAADGRQTAADPAEAALSGLIIDDAVGVLGLRAARIAKCGG